MAFDRLPSIPLIANDPYFSIWLPADLPTGGNTTHWTGVSKPMHGYVEVDGVNYSFLGRNGVRAAKTTRISVTPTSTFFDYEVAGIKLEVRFWAPVLPEDLDALSTPMTFADIAVTALDGKKHSVGVRLEISDAICYDGATHREMNESSMTFGDVNLVRVGQKNQKVLCHSGDWITIDWGWLNVASKMPVRYNGSTVCCEFRTDADMKTFVAFGYDDIASINYFGTHCKAWYARNGRTLVDAMLDYSAKHDALLAACDALDAKVLSEAMIAGGEDYQKIVSAGWRHTFAAHKLIATPNGEMAFLSKENDSNGCIGTVDVSYPSIPVMLRFCPELVNALCRPVLEFASMPVWKFDFAPHDVGRYPQAIGQVYACKQRRNCGDIYPEYYLYPADSDVYNDRYQMPVEECGNMLVMLWTAIRFGADDSLAKKYMNTLQTWVKYLEKYGEDPAEQLCTDDFAGHLARNINLSAKALVGMRCYAELLNHFGDAEGAAEWKTRAKRMADSWYSRAFKADGTTALTFDGIGWSMKYNLVWDKLLGFELLPEDFYRKETESYLPHVNEFGLPLDSRADYTKSDWICWCAGMAEGETRRKLLAPIAHYLQATKTRVAFSDWYDTVGGNYVAFIARSVQGGVFMPLLAEYVKTL